MIRRGRGGEVARLATRTVCVSAAGDAGAGGGGRMGVGRVGGGGG